MVLSARCEGNSRKPSQQVRGPTRKGGGQHGGGVGNDHVVGRGRRKGGYDVITGAVACARDFAFGAAAGGNMCQRKAEVAMKCRTDGHAVFFCWHCLGGGARMPAMFVFSWGASISLRSACFVFPWAFSFRKGLVPQMSKTSPAVHTSIGADVFGLDMWQCFPMLDEPRVKFVRVQVLLI